MKRVTLSEHLFGLGPKRILALDGGGVRGVLTLGYLKRIEHILQQRYGAECRLCDYFDLIGGTSTGAIIATGLALGFTVEKLQLLYHELASEIFKKPFWRVGLIGSKFPTEPLARALQTHFGDATLGSDELNTGLMVITKRLDTGSPWVIHNNPKGIFYDRHGSEAQLVPNRNFLLRQVLRASTAAPHYFEPERLEVAQGLEGVFVDGGMSPFNNPSLQLLFLATLGGFGLNWPLGPDKLLLVSVGTGYMDLRVSPEQVMTMSAAMLSIRALTSLMSDCDWLTQTFLQWISNSPTRWEIDREIGDLQGSLFGKQQWLSYLRYNVHLDPGWLKATLDINMGTQQTMSLFEMDDPKNIEVLSALGMAGASVQVKQDHFPASFDFS